MQKWTLAQIKKALKELSEKGWVKYSIPRPLGRGLHVGKYENPRFSFKLGAWSSKATTVSTIRTTT